MNHLAAASTLALLLVAAPVMAQDSMPPSPTTPSAQPSSAQPTEPSSTAQPSRGATRTASKDVKTFVDNAASSDLLEIESGRLATERATDPGLKQFGEQMIADHSAASSELKSLAQSKGITPPAAMLPRHQKLYDQLVKAEDGEKFDDAYRKLMVSSHKEAVTLFDKTARTAKDPDVKAFAAKTLPTLQQHGAHAKTLKEHGKHSS